MSVLDISEKILKNVEKVAEKYNLRLVVLYGSQAKGKSRPESDIDIAVLGENTISFENIIDLNNDFAQVFEAKETDVKSLHRADPLFRFQVTKDGILLFGEKSFYNGFRAYAFRDFHDSRDLFRMKEIIINKRLKALAS